MAWRKVGGGGGGGGGLVRGERSGGGRRAWILILFCGVPRVGLMVVIDVHYELEASHDGRQRSLDLEVRYTKLVLHSPAGVPRQIERR